ncbi:hypothetical protein ABB37_04599 [Leptomonas pyrrhocoris]|uniref:Uncharacterized protein n=1 Tax=Leptomonas pyrrhocoris TaxID=157538 RepID=A0A0N0VF89_LEPPY|nr:hypothetical protein ABB37_04599 [Leptomonas pyrrhocoris]KPA80321.1 hypothetical protein ABB37_04599 [Leptomonas pyrrhocoris]|eukprot:XP_015658760.1 hypothetical protein ABB37_04599 [Leptomonas pyrrhocoris]
MVLLVDRSNGGSRMPSPTHASPFCAFAVRSAKVTISCRAFVFVGCAFLLSWAWLTLFTHLRLLRHKHTHNPPPPNPKQTRRNKQTQRRSTVRLECDNVYVSSITAAHKGVYQSAEGSASLE